MPEGITLQTDTATLVWLNSFDMVTVVDRASGAENPFDVVALKCGYGSPADTSHRVVLRSFRTRLLAEAFVGQLATLLKAPTI